MCIRDRYHVALCGEGSNTYRLYVDGAAVENSSGVSAISVSGSIDTNYDAMLGRGYHNYADYYIDGYVFDFRYQKGVDTSGAKPSAPFELNPVYIGGDQSGNKNHFTPTNISQTHDVMLDTPTKNYAAINVLHPTGAVTAPVSEGNLKIYANTYSGSNYEKIPATIPIPTSGKWYVEFYAYNANNDGNIGSVGVVRQQDGTWGSSSGTHYGLTTGNGFDGIAPNIYGNNITLRSSGAVVDTDSGGTLNNSAYICALAIDVDNGKIYGGYESGGAMTWMNGGDPTSGSTGTGAVSRTFSSDDLLSIEVVVSSNNLNKGGFVMNFGQDRTFAGNKTSGQDTSQSEFYYAPPTGFKSLNTSNLDDPTVTPSENFGIALYNGTSSSNSITGLGFQPDLLYTKSRSTSGSSPKWFDSLRGVTKRLETNTAGAETTQSTELTSFDSDGFTLGSGSGSNYSGRTYVGWCWKAHQGGSTSYSHTLTLDVRDNYGYGSGWGTTKLEVWEGSTKLTDITNPPSSSSKIYNIKTNDLDKIKIVWYVDGSAGDWYNMYAVLKNSSNTTLASWDGNSWSGNSSDAPSDDDNFYLPSSFDSTNAATTGVVEATDADTERYNSSAGFTIIKYAGAGSTDGDTKTLDHSLGVPLEFVIAKARTSNDGYDNGDWIVWHKDLASSKYLYLNSSSATRTEASGYNLISTATSGTQHQVVVNNGSDNSSYNYHYLNSGPDNGTGEDYILYGWAGVEGYSKFGKYTGNGSSDGPFIYTGFRPAFVLWKRASGSSNSWNIMDNKREGYNPQNDLLFPDTQGNESNVTDQDLLSNGFKLRTTGSGRNANGNTFIYAAFAESPFKHANAR